MQVDLITLQPHKLLLILNVPCFRIILIDRHLLEMLCSSEMTMLITEFFLPAVPSHLMVLRKQQSRTLSSMLEPSQYILLRQSACQ
jgi:hypothetical protein